MYVRVNNLVFIMNEQSRRTGLKGPVRRLLPIMIQNRSFFNMKSLMLILRRFVSAAGRDPGLHLTSW